MKSINIHGKQYIEVNERIKYFREAYDHWSLISEIIELTDERCVIKASVLNEENRVISTGIAYEMLGSSFINKTSFVENCETSAWGRALGNLGIGIDTSIASADEVQNAIKQQESKNPEKLNDKKYKAMIVEIGKGNTKVVKERMKNYILTKTQQTKLDKLIKETERDEILTNELAIVQAMKEYNNK